MDKKYLTIILLVLLANVNIAQSMTGISGLFTIPTANINDEGEVNFGFFYQPQKYSYTARNKPSDALIYYGSVVFLPFLELNLRFTYPFETSPSYIGDRMPSAKIRFNKESQYFPSIAVGFHDFFSDLNDSGKTSFNNSTYLVMTKTISNTKTGKIAITLGYGSDLFEANHYQFLGFFGGISYSFLENFELFSEYDAEKFNSGIRIDLFNHLRLLMGSLNHKDFVGGINIFFQL